MAASPALPAMPIIMDGGMDYAVDSIQRGILFWDAMRQRGNQYREQVSKDVPHVLSYETELVADGREMSPRANYLLARIVPPKGVKINPGKRPFVVVDPRAGHGPGIGGFKADSEIGVAMAAGNPCYFVGFLPDPVPGQTIADIASVEAAFLEKVASLHPDADGKPCVIGNCQAGWAVMMLAAVRPELFGPIIVAGSPLSYWQGVHGQYPMRYSGGLLGGSWLTAMTSDLGGGIFDGAWLVQNFENQNPANTLWSKQYNLYSKIDTEVERYLSFERWWGVHVNLNAEEIQFIVDELFVGNKLAAGSVKMADGTVIDLRNIRSPIVVFCSKGDNITPPQQALGWILDLYDSVGEIRDLGQTIVYTVHEDAGHLGIFVSAGVARKEHGEFSSNIDLIDTLPPGLYEAVLEPKPATNAHLTSGEWSMRCEPRSLDDIRALGGNDAADERRFATAARVSEANLALYRTFMQPFVKMMATPPSTSLMAQMHPLRLQYSAFSDANPFTWPLRIAAEMVRKDRRPGSAENPLAAMQEKVSDGIVDMFETWRKATEQMSEQMFLNIYGSPVLQRAMGIDPDSDAPLRRAAKNPLHEQLKKIRTGELRANIPHGGAREAVIRGLVYAGMARGSIDERSFEMLRRIREEHTELSLAEFKRIVREQFYMLLIDADAALEALPAMLPKDEQERAAGFAVIGKVLEAGGEVTGDVAERLERVRALFGVKREQQPKTPVTSLDSRRKQAS
jgi:hypothetical protein